MTATTPPIDLLREACSTGDLPSNASLSEDGKFLTILGSTFDATTPQTMALGGDGDRVVNYTLASVYLQLINPALLRYHKACGSAGVRDPVKTLDRDHVISHFFLDADNNSAAAAPKGSSGGADDVDGARAGATGGEDEYDDDMDVASDEEDPVAAVVARPSRSSKDGRRSTRDRDDDGGSSGKRRRVGGGTSSSSKKSSRLEKYSRGSREEDGRAGRRSSGEGGGGGGGKTKAPSVPITNEQLVANLGKIVDKRHTGPTTPAKEGGDGIGAAAAAESEVDADGDNVGESAPATPAPTTIAPDDDGHDRTAEAGGGVDRELLLAWLSPDGFRVDSPTVASAIEADREAVRRITASEIPVGDSASVLRAGAGGEVFGGVGAGGETTTASTVPSPAAGGGGVKKRDFARVLEIYQEVAAMEERARRMAVASSSSKGGKGRPLPPPPPSNNGKASSSSATVAAGGMSTKTSVAGNPIIVVPNAMTSVITMINAGIFLGKEGVYLSREQAMSDPAAGKRGGTVTVTRKLAPRLGGSEITYEIIDNPATRLKKDEWNRVVAVICQGASWQFKGWRYSDPVDLFSRTFGFYIGLDGAAVPNELQGWNVKIGRVSRDRRGLDNVCLASFWNGLEEFMAVHKQDFINS